jgi:hypothetical protein
VVRTAWNDAGIWQRAGLAVSGRPLSRKRRGCATVARRWAPCTMFCYDYLIVDRRPRIRSVGFCLLGTAESDGSAK